MKALIFTVLAIVLIIAFDWLINRNKRLYKEGDQIFYNGHLYTITHIESTKEVEIQRYNQNTPYDRVHKITQIVSMRSIQNQNYD